MKRIFQRRARSPSASSSSESSPAAATTALSPRRAASASFKTSTAPIGAELAEIRASKVAVGSETLHAKVAAFATSVSAEERQQALDDLYDVLVVATLSLDGAGSHGEMLNGRDNDTLVSVTAQRLRSCFNRSLELFNADRLDGKVDAMFSLATASQERDYVLQMLQILKVLVVKGDNAQALLLVGERISSTFVKVVKALSDGDYDACGELVVVILEVLAALVTSPEVVQELNETSTLHRIFHLAFREEKLQMAVVKVVESLVQGLQPNRWRSMVKHLYEGRCILELIHNANGTGVLAKAVLVTALSLRRARDAGLYDLHRQMHTERQRHKILAMFIKMFEFRLQEISEKKTQTDFRQDGQDLADAVAELCLSGNESPLPRSDIYQNKAFRLAFDGGTPNVAASLFNVEAFGLLSDILTYLHRKTKFEEMQDCDEHVCEMLRDNREQFECHFLEKLCQIVVAYRFDYEFVSTSGVITRIIEELDDYSEMAQHTVLSVLSAIAIEARVIPFTELAAINAFIRKDTFQRRSIHALLAFGVNLLRFDDAYHDIFRSVGLVSTLVALFLDQTTTLCSDAASTQIRVEFPTRTVGGDEPNGTPHFVDESSIVSLLASHCHQRARRRSPHRSAMGQTDFLTLVDIMKLLGGGVRGDSVTIDEQYFERTLCGLPMLESICTLIGNSSFQQEGLALWGSIIRVALILQRNDEVLRNVVNSFLQAVRYVTLAVYFPQDGQVTVAFPGNLVVLQGALAYLEALLRSKDALVANSMQYEKPFCEPDFTLRNASERNRVLGALLDCDVILSLLGTLCAVAKKWEVNTNSTNHSDDNNAGSLMMLSLQLIFSVVTTSTEASRLFVSSISFGNFGDLIGNLLAHYNEMTKARKGSKITSDDSALETDTLVVFCVRHCIGFSLGDYEMACLGGTFSSASTLLKDGGRSAVLRYPNAFAVAIQLLSIWGGELDTDSVLQLMDLLQRISAFPGNSYRLASANVLEIMLRSFTATARRPKEPLERNEGMVSQALLCENNVFHELAVSLVENVALASVSPSAANYWVKMLVSLFRDRSKQLRAQNLMGYRTGMESKPTELKKASATPVPTLLRLLLKLTSATFGRTQGAPAIEFDISKEGFGCLQIPDVNARSSSSSDAGSPAPSLSTFSHNSKVWPPPEGYSVMIWFRVDSYERKEEREKLYRECFMSNSCIHCRGKVHDEYVLKCSHRACRGCIEALLNSGGECVVCNPPIFYIFRFRSSDGKSVSEAFLKGGKLYMRTSSNRASVYQFSHTPIKTKQWHQVVFTHAKQRFQSSMVSCYLNGILQENVKIPYPSSITGSQPLSGLIGVPSQARRCSTTKWTLGPFYLLDLPISAPVVNAAFAAGPSYDRLFFGATGNNEIAVTFDHLNITNMEMLDLYMWDPVRSLIDSVDVERTGRNKLLRRSLSLASAASSTAAALVQDIKSSANVFSRIPSAVPLIHVPVPSERILVAYSARNGVTNDLQAVLSSKLDGRPSGHLMGGTVLRDAATMASAIFDISSSGCQIAYVLLDEASTEEEVELALNLLGLLLQNNSRNLTAMENDHGYGIVNYLLHKKASLLSTNSLQIIFRIVGVRIELENPKRQLETTTHASSDSAIRNVQALQYFILDYSLWQKAPEVNISKLLFSTLYSCLAADDEAIRERNRAQLQSISFIRQLLYVLLDPTVTADLLRVIVDVILVCLTSSNREATVEANFADVTSFLTSTVSPRFGHYKEEVAGEEMLADDGWSVHRDTVDDGRLDPLDTELMKAHTLASPTARLCLSPRGSQRMIGYCWDAQKISKLNPGPTNWVDARLISHQSKIQELLFETLLKAVQKLEIKEARDHGNDFDNSVADSSASNASRSVATANNASNGGTSRMQLPSATRLTGFRKYLGLRWIEYFLFPGDETEFSVGIAPSTVIAALNLLGTLLGNSRYEIVFKKEGYYRLLAQGLPCNHLVFSNLAVDADEVSFPFEKMWYALFSALLGPPIDGTPHEIRLELEYLGKDFEMNIQRDRIVNSSILLVIMILLRRHFNDPVAMVSIIGGISTDKLTCPDVKIKQEGGDPSTTATTSFLDQSGIYHLEVLDFLQHIFEGMPSLHTLFMSGNEKLRLEFMEELTRLICAAARACLVAQYPYSQEHIIQVLQDKQVAVTEYNVAIGRAELAEEAAATDASGNDPFLHHTVAARGLRLLIALLMKVLLDAPNGHDLVEEYVVGTATSSVVLPPLHNGLLLRFQNLVVMGLLDHIRVKFDDDDILVKHKYFGENVREFVRFVVEKMHSWQRAQHGDGCPPAFACCGRAHFLGGPSRLLELVLYVLSETNVGPAGIDGGGPSSLAAPAPSSFGSMLTDKLSKGKKRRPFRQLMDRMNISRSADGDNLQLELYTALNAVILHVLHGRAAEVSDEELEAMLQQVHLHREVVFGLQNQDTTFFSCLCRYLLQLVSDSASSSLQDAAAHLWIDLMMFRRAFIAELLTVEIRKTGAPPYSVNLMKNGFDVLLDCSKIMNNPSERGIVQSPDFIKFLKWLELVGPPLKELESSLDRLYISTVLETKERVHEVWAAYHKKASHRKAKYEKQFDARYDWFVLMETQYVESLLRSQQIEFRRQLKWKQDRVDRQKFIVRQWGHIQQDFQRNTLGSSEINTGEEKVGEVVSATTYDPVLMLEIANKSNYVVVSRSHQEYSWRLDFTEGPYRMRKRFSRMILSSEILDQPSSSNGVTVNKTRSRLKCDLNAIPHRRYSDSDVEVRSSGYRESPTHVMVKHRITRQKSDESMEGKKQLSATKGVLASSASTSTVLSATERLHKGSFEALFNKYVKSDRRASRHESFRFSRLSARRESFVDHDERTDDAEENASGIDIVESSNIAEVTAGSGNVALEENVDEKLRPLLMPGDEITDIYDCLRIDGMDSCPGVFLLCNDHLYIIDNYQRLSQRTAPIGSDYGEENSQIRVTEVPQGSTTLLERRLSWRLQKPSQQTQTRIPRSKDIHQCRYWGYDDITELHKRRYQLRHVALEIFANDGRNYLVTLETPEQRELVFHALLNKCPNVQGAASGLDGVAGRGDLYSQLRKLLRNNMTERWVQGDISNFAYLMHLNTLAGRSYNDLTQYPVFPWILADYDSGVLDVNNPGVYRDLSKPMGALRREEEFRARYEGLLESVVEAGDEEVDHPLSSRPFHYGTHYSSAAITLHYLMRLEPFTSHFRRLHGGKFDLADRLFTSIGGAWKSAAGFEGAQNGTQDVKELIPEFFYLPEFLENVNECVFGTSQTGIVVGDVVLPPWANGSPSEFVRLNRAALESPFVSANLHNWIDLIFGYKQQGPEAVEACNVFYHLTYEGSVDLDAITDPSTKRAMLDQITEFGQTPSQLFRTAHPVRATAASVNSTTLTNSSLFASSVGPLSSANNVHNGPTESGASTSANANSSRIATSPVIARAALANSFLEGGELITRMQTILSNGPGLSGTFVGTTEGTPSPVLENSALLEQEPRRQVPVNPLLALYRRGHQLSSMTSGNSSNVQHIAWTSGSVGREEKVVTTGPRCLLIPPRNNEYLAWGFQDRSVKVISTGSPEIGGHGSDSKVVACLELEVEIDVATITTDGRVVVTSSPGLPVLRVWRFNSTRRSLAASIAAASGSSSASATSSSASAVATSLAAASSLSAPHRRRTYTTMGPSSTRSLTMIGSIGSPAHHQRITALQASRAYSVLVSGCAGGVAVLWDLNRRRFIRQLPPISSATSGYANSISAICINEVTGDIVVAAGATFGVFNVNGAVRVRLDDSVVVFQDPTALSPAYITSLAVNRGEACEWSSEKHVVTGHADGTLCVWAYSQAGGRNQNTRSRRKDDWVIELQGRHKVTPRSAITAVCVTPDKRKLYTGTHDGQLSVWTATLPNSSP